MAHVEFLDRIEALLRVNLPAAEARRYDLRRMAEHCVATAEGKGLADPAGTARRNSGADRFR